MQIIVTKDFRYRTSGKSSRMLPKNWRGDVPEKVARKAIKDGFAIDPNDALNEASNADDNSAAAVPVDTPPAAVDTPPAAVDTPPAAVDTPPAAVDTPIVPDAPQIPPEKQAKSGDKSRRRK